MGLGLGLGSSSGRRAAEPGIMPACGAHLGEIHGRYRGDIGEM